ncbi:MAG: elongation factor G [Spirochaetota bacterium]
MKKTNIALTGHTSVGKTLLLDTLLYDIDAVDTIGRVDEGKSLSDYDDEEIKRKISIRSTIFNINYDNTVINLIDTPGSSDFSGEVVSCLYGVDSVLLLIDAVSGVEIETAKIWNKAQSMDLPVIVFINKMDKEHADYRAALENIKNSLKTRVLPMQLPIGQESSFRGIIDLLNMKAYTYEGNLKKGEETDLPSESQSEAEELRNEIVETAAESTDELTEKYLEGEDLTDEEIIGGLRKIFMEKQAVPVFYGSSLTNRGLREAFSRILMLAPPSNYRGSVKALEASDQSTPVEIPCSSDSFFSGIVFKTVLDQFAGKLSYIRIWSGALEQEQEMINTRKDAKEKVSKLQVPFGKNQLPLNRNAEEGDIIVLTKLPHAETGDTLCTNNKLVVFPELQLPNPVHSVAIKAKNKNEEDKLGSLLQRTAEEDISFKMEHNNETKQTVISGMGELQIDIILSRIKGKYGIDIDTSTPLIPYRETIQAPAKASYRHKKQTGGHGQYGEVYLEIEPLERGSGFEFVDKIVGGVIPKGYIPGVEKGVKEAMEEGVVAGYPAVDTRVSLVYGSYHDVDSSELAFKIAGRQAFKLAMENAKPTLLEPVMDLTVYVDDRYTGDIISDLNSRRGRVLGMDSSGGGIQVIRAKVPQAELLKYSIELRSITSGTGSFEMGFSHYDPISGKIAEDVIKATQQRKQEEK